MNRPTPDPSQGGEQAFVRVLSVPLLGRVRDGFTVPMHSEKPKGALHELRPLRPVQVRIGSTVRGVFQSIGRSIGND